MYQEIIISKILRVPFALISKVCSGIINEVWTWDWAARLYTSSGWILVIKLPSEEESVKSEKYIWSIILCF